MSKENKPTVDLPSTVDSLKPTTKVILCVLDGWGFREQTTDNAVALAATPVFDQLWAHQPRGLLQASGAAVGLPEGQIGNSEVGHLNLGAGRVVLQDLPMIDQALATHQLEDHPLINHLVIKLHNSQGRCHLLGLVSPGGVHAHQEHIAALARLLITRQIPVVVHLFTDGRDVAPQSALQQVSDFVAQTQGVQFGTVSGRYYAMDRDHRWQRTVQAYQAIACGQGQRFQNPLAVIEQSYDAGITDEFIVPAVIDPYAGVADGDALLMANFRADRVRQLLTALVDPDFTMFTRPRLPNWSVALGMKPYSEQLSQFMKALFQSPILSHGLGEVIAAASWHQLRLAETEKYPHVTFFFNGGGETHRPVEQHIMVPSPKVATYDLQPDMSANAVTEQLLAAMADQRFDFILANYANPDMVGHTGNLSAAIKAVAVVDKCLGKIVPAATHHGYTILLTADHGNCELMRDPVTYQPHTAHTTSPVPVILINGPSSITHLRNGKLADVAPTVLALMGHPQPSAMTGQCLFSL